MKRNKDGYTVITGASSGIGRETAKAFAERGSNLILTARRMERLEALRRELWERYSGLEIVLRKADLSESDEVLSLYESVKDYPLRTWVNNAGVGDYGRVGERDAETIRRLLRLDVEALAILSMLFVRDFQDTDGAQLINVSSCGGYTIVPNAVVYCAAKFFVSAFTEGLARELRAAGAKMQAKVFAPAATETEFGKTANHVSEYDYRRAFEAYHTSAQAAAFLLELHESDRTVGAVERDSLTFHLCGPQLPYAGDSRQNQRL